MRVASLKVAPLVLAAALAAAFGVARLQGDTRQAEAQAAGGLLALRATADASLSRAHPSVRYGGARTLFMRGASASRVIVRFRVPTPFRSATLRLFAKNRGDGLVVRRAATSTWSERRVTFANGSRARLSRGPVVRVAAFRGSSWIQADVTRLMPEGGEVSLILSAPPGRSLNFASRESGSRAPRLDVLVASAESPVIPAATSPSTTSTTGGAAAPAPPVRPIIVVAAGDVACDPASGSFKGGVGTASSCTQEATAKLVERINPDAVLMLGDAQYEYGNRSEVAASYGPSWGRFKDKTWATAGGLHDFYGGGYYYEYFGARAGPAAFQPYSINLGAWRVISLNAQCGEPAVGGCKRESPQETWLRNDLTINRNKCTLAMWHNPRWSSRGRHGSNTATDAFVRALHAAGAEMILSAHDHHYERFVPMNPDGGPDAAFGLRQFVVGTGGKSLGSIDSVAPGSEVRQNHAYGVLKLSLFPDRYDWEFVPVVAGAYADSGSVPCHDAPPAP